MWIFRRTVFFSRASGSFKGGVVMSLEEGMTYWDLVLQFMIIIPPHRIGEFGSFGFDPRRNGAANICFAL